MSESDKPVTYYNPTTEEYIAGIDPAKYTYSRNERNFLIRNEDRAGVLEDENFPNNVGYALYLKWLELGNDPIPLHTISPSLYPSRVDPLDFTYTRNERNVIVRSDGVLVFEHPDDPVYRLYLAWVDDGNEPPPLNPDPPPPPSSYPPPNFTYRYNDFNILTRSDGVFIPENNPDDPAYKMYLQWLADGNPVPPLSDISNLPTDPVYKSPYSPHSPTYGEPSPLPNPEQPLDPSLDVATKGYVNDQIAHAVAHALGRSHSH
jgi:hypothetical protein